MTSEEENLVRKIIKRTKAFQHRKNVNAPHHKVDEILGGNVGKIIKVSVN